MPHRFPAFPFTYGLLGRFMYAVDSVFFFFSFSQRENHKWKEAREKRDPFRASCKIETSPRNSPRACDRQAWGSKTSKSFGIKALEFYSALISPRWGTRYKGLQRCKCKGVEKREGRGVGGGPTGRSVTSLFNSLFFLRERRIVVFYKVYTRRVHVWHPQPNRLWLYCAATAASYVYISIRVLYSRSFIRLSFNCPIFSAPRVTASRGYFAPGSKVRTTMETRTRIIACSNVLFRAGCQRPRFEILPTIQAKLDWNISKTFPSRQRLLRGRRIYVSTSKGEMYKCRILLRDAIGLEVLKFLALLR